MKKWSFTKGLHDLGDGVFAYLQPGSWGFNNAGLVTSGDQSMLVDTLMDVRLTQEMLEVMKVTTPAASFINIVVNTHGDGDHWFANQVVRDSEIIASEAAVEEMKLKSPEKIAAMMKNADPGTEMGKFMLQMFGVFEYGNLATTLPNRTFKEKLEINVGEKSVQLIEVGPAHTKGDVIVYLPSHGIVFAGDILFIDSTPIIWEGPVSNWLKACDIILGLKADVIVPGHGPITDKEGVRRFKAYWEHIIPEARKRFEAGMSAAEAAHDIPLGYFASWGEKERIVVNVDSLYREFGNDEVETDETELWVRMAQMSMSN